MNAQRFGKFDCPARGLGYNATLVTIFEDKSALRREMILSVRNLTAEQRREKSRAILERLIAHSAMSGKVCGFYAHLPSEPDLSELLKAPLLSKMVFCVPRVNGSGMTFHRITDFDGSFSVSSKGIREPLEKAPRILPQEIDVLIIPALAYSESSGHRLGRGGGFYDRFLQIPQSTKRIGVCFDEQLVEKVPVEKHDKQAEIVITDKRCIEF